MRFFARSPKLADLTIAGDVPESAHPVHGAKVALDLRAVEDQRDLRHEAGELAGERGILVGGAEKVEQLLADR